MNQVKNIYKKIGEVMSKVSRVPKNGYNSFHKYNYATESDLTESIRPILQESGLAFFSNVLEQDRDGEFTKVKMEFTLADIETGEILTSTYWGEGQDKGDKGLYKAYTGATKYFLMKTFLIPTGDDPEADSTVDEPNCQKPKNSKGPKIQSQMASDAQLNLINKLLVDVAKHTGSTKEKAYQSLRNQMKKEMEWYTQDEAGEAIVILNKVLKKGA